MATTRTRKAAVGDKPLEVPASAEIEEDEPDLPGKPIAVIDAEEDDGGPPLPKATIALARSIPADAAGTLALAQMSDEEFSERLATLKRGRDRIATIQRDLMVVDVDYGLIPGTPKPTLFKSGAEKLAQIYGLAAEFATLFVGGDGERQPLLKYESRCFLHLGSFEGAIVGMGEGTANGWEKRYRRESDKECPNCGKAALIRSKYEPGWYCFDKKGGCKSKFSADDERIATQVTDARGDPVAANDLQNTLLKMAEKRAFVDAVLRATASSSLFTQDVAEEPADTITTSGGTTVDTYGQVVDDAPPPEFQTATDVGVVERGGHRPEVTGSQIQALRELAVALKLSPWQVADEIAEVLGGGIDSTTIESEDKAGAGAELLKFMEAMDPNDMGRVITHLRKKTEAK